MRSQNVVDAFFAQTAKTVTGSQDPALTSPNLSDYAGPSATVANTLSLPPEFPDAIRDICHPCHPLSGAIAITLLGAPLNMADPTGANAFPQGFSLDRLARQEQFGRPSQEMTTLAGAPPTLPASGPGEDHSVDAD